MDSKDTHKLEMYMKEHKFERERFISEIRMMTKVSLELGEPKHCRLKIDMIERFSDQQLAKAHKFYWDQL